MSSLRTSATSRGVLRLAVREGLHGALVEHAALDRAALEDGALGRVELIEASREQRVDGGRDADLATPGSADQRDHLLDEERIALGGRGDALTQHGLGAAQLLQEPLGLCGVERLEQHGRGVELAAAPGGPRLEEFRPGHAQQQDRSVASEVGDVLDEVEQSLLGPVQVVEHADERLLVRLFLEQLAEGPGDLLRRRRGVRLAEQRRGSARLHRRLAARRAA